MKIAVEGCCHGQLDDIYGSLRLLEQRENIQIDLLVICGDFQSIRNEADMYCMAVPDKYREIGSFWKYYSGIEKAPYPTVFIGGNHEASNYLWELYHGGWVSDNIYYLGHAGVIQFGSVRIGGLSGIYRDKEYAKGHYEKSPYSPATIRSSYYVREYDVKKLLQINQPLDVFISHDWPRGVERYGDVVDLVRKKNFFKDEIISNTLGSYANEVLLEKLQPDYWFSAHLHVKYAALVNHTKRELGIPPPDVKALLEGPQQKPVTNPDEISIDFDEENKEQEKEVEKSDDGAPPKVTKFLSLDKCLPGRQFLQIVDIPTESDDTNIDFYYDMEWLAITRAMHPYLSTDYHQTPIPSDSILQESIQKEMAFLKEQKEKGALDLKIPHNFECTTPSFNPQVPMNREDIRKYQFPIVNPQTEIFCKEIGIENKINISVDPPQKRPKIDDETVEAQSEIIINDDEFL